MVAMTVLPLLMTAGPINQVAAHEVAARFMKSGDGTSLRSRHAALRLCLTHPSATDAARADYYVFSAADTGGFIIIAGDDRARQVLAYGDGPFDPDHVPANVQWLLDGYAEQMEYLFSHPEVQPAHSPAPSKVPSVPQMLTTRWGQRTPYRDQCPMTDGNRCVTGCVATAMAQVMNYWKFPSNLPSLPSYSTSTLTLPVPALPAATVNWSQMLDSYSEGNYTDEQGAAVALLMRYCGQACKMDYRIASSSALVKDQNTAFKLFGYNQDATFEQRDDYNDEQWHAMIQEDLQAGYPVIYAGSSMTMNHCFVLDGFDGSRYHVNWGWDGMYDGYFELDAMNGGGFTPSLYHQMLHGIHPQGEVVSSDFVVDGICYNRIGTAEAEVTYKDENFDSYSGDIVIPDTVNLFGTTYAVKAIGDNAFRGCSSLTQVTIPGTVTRIGNGAFMSSDIPSIVIPDSVAIMEPSAFMNCKKLASVTLSNSLTELSDDAFNGCSKLTEVVLPPAIKSIGSSAFARSGLMRITIPDGVATMGGSTFSQCRNLREVTLSNSLTEVSDDMFNGCIKLTGIVLPQAINSIGSGAFARSGLTGITIPDGVKTIGASAFSDCAGLQQIDIPAGVTSIGEEAFMNCASLQRMKLGGALTTVGKSAFEGCTGMTRVDVTDEGAWCKISFSNEHSNPLSCGHHLFVDGEEVVDMVIPDSVTGISAYAFYNATALVSVTFPAGLASVGASAFKGCSSLKRLYISDVEAWLQIDYVDNASNPLFLGCRVYYNGQELSPDLVIPESVTRIGKKAFVNCSWLNSISIPPGVTDIGEDAFAYCSNLDALYIQDLASWCGIRFRNSYSNPMCNNMMYPNKTLHTYVEGEDISLGVLEIPVSVITIGDYAFVGSRFSGIAFHEGLQAIGTDAFGSNRNCKEIVFPSSLTVLGKEAFTYCSSLTSVQFPDAMDSIGDRAFYYSTLASVTLPDNIRSLGTYVFGYCYVMTDADLGECLEKIPDGTFDACRNLVRVTYPETVTEIGENAFSGCAFTELPLSHSIRHIGDHAFAGCRSIKKAVLGDHVMSIGKDAFKGCHQLDSVDIGNGVNVIQEYAFYGCANLKHVTIGCNVDTVAHGTFIGCQNIRDFTCRAKQPPVVTTNSSSGWFEEDCFGRATLYVPKTSVKSYKSADQWSRFYNIVGVRMSNMAGDVNEDAVVNISDVNVIIHAVLTGEVDPDLDVNGDGDVNITDINAIINIILQG